MSRRRVSIKDLGAVDCQGWLLRRKEGRSLLGSKWKRYWFVLKRSCLYWYTDKMAEKAEGFINLPGFTIEQAKQCKRKHTIRASHPLVVTIFIAAESFTDMNKWIGKLSDAAEPCDLIDTGECYSEGSDRDGDECASTSCSLDPKQEVSESENGEDRRRAASDGGESLSWLDLTDPDGAGGAESLPSIQVRQEEEEVVRGKRLEPRLATMHQKPLDEMELLYNHLKAASLSPIGQSGVRDFRRSFIRRCKDDKVNEKLHLLRILTSTLKAKESALQAVEQILAGSTLTPPTYRKWRLSNTALLLEIGLHNQAAGGAAELRRRPF